jgi:hypothetical protein
MKKLQIALDNAYETVGYKILPVLGDYVTVLADVSDKALNAEKSNSKFDKVLGMVVNHVFQLDAFKIANKLIGNYAEEIRGATDATDDFERVLRLQNMFMSKETVVLKDNEKAQRSNTDAKDKAKQKAKEYADTLRERVQTSLDTVNDSLKKAQDEFDALARTTSESITSMVSLADAVRTQDDAEGALQASLRDRAEAYAKLAKTDPTKDAEDYAQALLDVAAAETAVSTAQTNRANQNYGKAFADQIANAKRFAANLELLTSVGLSREGLGQLINLGPVAGVKVTDEMLSGTSSLRLEDLNQGLAGLSASANSLGLSTANAFLGSALGTATANQGQVNQYSITVNAGLVSNPAQVGRDIIEAIKNAERVSGQVFVSV